MGKQIIRFLSIAVLLLTTGNFSIANAATAADSNIKGAIADIERYEKQFPDSASARASNIKRALKLLKLTRQRLDSSNNKSHDSWIEADERFKSLISKLQSKLEKPATTTTTTTQQSTTQQSSATTNTSTTKSTLISQDHVRLKKLARDIESATDSLNTGGVKPFQDPAYVRKFEDASLKYQKSLNKYSSFQNDPGVQKASTALAKFNNMIQFGKDQAQPVLAELGDVQARLRNLENTIRQRPFPQHPPMPYKDTDIINWIKAAAPFRKVAIENYQTLAVIAEKAWLPNNSGVVQQGAKYDMNDVSRLQNSLRGDVEKIDGTVKQIELNLNAGIDQSLQTIEWWDALDPKNEHQQVNNFIGESSEATAMEILNKELQLAEAALSFDQALNRKTIDQRKAWRDRVKTTIVNYQARRNQALNLSRMPKADSTDNSLIETALKTLEKPSYGAGKILRLLINSDKVTREEESSEIEIDEVDVSLSGKIEMSGTETTTFYKWEQYQVATAEPVDNKFFIFYNTLKYYTSGASTTPLNRWILSNRIKGAEILEANIKK